MECFTTSEIRLALWNFCSAIKRVLTLRVTLRARNLLNGVFGCVAAQVCA